MALITKDTIAEILGFTDEDDISDSVFTWATKQFFLMTDLKEAEESKTHRKIINTTTTYIKLPDTDIKSIDTLLIDNESQDIELFSNVKFNPDTGLMQYTGGFGGGQLIEVTYTINAYTHLDVHDYIISLLVSKALSLFTPDRVQQVKSFKIGNYQKSFGSSASSLEQYQKMLDMEIDRVIDVINGNDGKMTMDKVL